MAAILLAGMSGDEAIALASTPTTISASDPRVKQVLALAAGSEDGDDMLATLRDAGFDDNDIAAIDEFNSIFDKLMGAEDHFAPIELSHQPGTTVNLNDA